MPEITTYSDHADMRAAIDGLELALVQARSDVHGYRTSAISAARDLVSLAETMQPLLKRAHAALLLDERNQHLLDELYAAALDLETARAKWAEVANKAA
jgi:hypothetical protein